MSEGKDNFFWYILGGFAIFWCGMMIGIYLGTPSNRNVCTLDNQQLNDLDSYIYICVGEHHEINRQWCLQRGEEHLCNSMTYVRED